MSLDFSAKRILVISLSNIGDVILTFPVIDILMRDFPAAEISVMVGPKARALLEGNPNIKEVILFEKRLSLRQQIGLFLDLRRRKFDVVLDLRNTALPVLLTSKVRAPIILNRYPYQHARMQHLKRLYSIHPYASEVVDKKALISSRADQQFVQDRLAQQLGRDARFLIVAPGAADSAKRWPAREFARLCDMLVTAYSIQIILVGDQNDEDAVGQVMAQMSHPVINLCGQLTLTQLAVLLKKSMLLITNDSAPLHMASYLQIPVLAIFGPTNPQRYGPWTLRSAVIEKKDSCPACCQPRRRLRHVCMENIKAEEVFKTIRLKDEGLVLNVGFFGSLEKKFEPAKNILIVRTDRIGDVVLTSPMVHALRQAWPTARLTMLVSAATRELVAGNPDLDEVLIDDRFKTNRGVWGRWKLVMQLRRRKFDLALILHTKARANWICFLSRIPHRLGFCFDKNDWLLTRGLADLRNQGLVHEAQYCLDVLQVLGIQVGELELFVPVHPHNEAWAQQFFQKLDFDARKPFIAVHVGASCPTKKWPIKFFIEVIQEILRRYSCQVILVGAPGVKADAQVIASAVQGPIVDLTGKTTVGQLASILKRCRMLISNDSGPVHIAAALGIGVVSIFTRNQGGINPERWRPLGPRCRWVAPAEDNGTVFCSADFIGGELLERVKPPEVLDAVDAVYKLC